LHNSFPLTQCKSGPVPKFIKHFKVQIRSIINKIPHSPDPVQSKSSPKLISGRDERSRIFQTLTQLLLLALTPAPTPKIFQISTPTPVYNPRTSK